MVTLVAAGWMSRGPEPRIRLVGPVEQGAAACLAIGEELSFDVHVEDPPFTVAAAQFGVSYNRRKFRLEGLEPGDPPFTELPFVEVDESAGSVLWMSSVPAASSGSDQAARVARLRFRVLQDDCGGSEQVAFDPMPDLVLIASGSGQSASLPLSNPAPVVIDSAPPILSGIPLDRTVRALGAQCQATLVLTPPTAADACSPSVPVTWTRSDGASALNAPWPCGTTVVTWRAVDACGRAATGTTRVKVKPRGGSVPDTFGPQ